MTVAPSPILPAAKPAVQPLGPSAPGYIKTTATLESMIVNLIAVLTLRPTVLWQCSSGKEGWTGRGPSSKNDATHTCSDYCQLLLLILFFCTACVCLQASASICLYTCDTHHTHPCCSLCTHSGTGQKNYCFACLYFELITRWWELLRIEGNDVVDWLSLVVSSPLSPPFVVLSFFPSSLLFALSHQSPEGSLSTRWALRLWDLRVTFESV